MHIELSNTVPDRRNSEWVRSYGCRLFSQQHRSSVSAAVGRGLHAQERAEVLHRLLGQNGGGAAAAKVINCERLSDCDTF